MRNLILLIALSCFSLCGFSQKIYVEPLESGAESILKEKIKFDGYDLTPYKDQADYLIKFEIDKAKTGGWSFSAYEGYVSVTDPNGLLLSKTAPVKKGTYIHNGYNAENAILKELAKKHLTKTIQKALKETAAK